MQGAGYGGRQGQHDDHAGLAGDGLAEAAEEAHGFLPSGLTGVP